MLGVSVRKWLGGAGNMTKKTGLAHSTWCVGSKMAWRGRLGRLGRLDWVGEVDRDRAVQADRRLREGGRNGSATIGS